MKNFFHVLAVCLLLATATFAQSSSSTSNSGPSSGASSTKRPPIFRPTKDQITQVQKILKEKKLYSGDATGAYNDETRSAIKNFQKDNSLKETGTLNRATLEKFGVALTDSQKAIPVSQSSFASSSTDKTSSSTKSTSGPIFRATSDQIKAAQKLLKSKSMYNGGETGKLDDDTRSGLKKFQEANGLKVTGTLNQVTLEKMGIELTDPQKTNATTTTPK
ncbi:MAG TPA: peptidoglycan-binding domain-containing protein [Pyrinomonadaceae bacterium]|nr:peptidoglycan-binding domain-containing protein [Pyrinomonadaceae bacterium]